jgi:K+-transporting ATPase ATPase C chain
MIRRDLASSVIAVLVLTVLFGLAYPLAMTGIGQVLFNDAANGSKIERDGETVGSSLIGQNYTRPALDPKGEPLLGPGGKPQREADPAYFQGRPSVTGNNPSGTFFNNLGPNQKDLFELFEDNLAAYLALNAPGNPGLAAADVPNDAVQTSASGVDPHISPENAEIQANRVAVERDAPVADVLALVEDNTDGRALGILGEPGVNVLELNLALDQEFPTDD